MLVIQEKQKFELIMAIIVLVIAVLGVHFFFEQEAIKGLWSWTISSVAFFLVFPALVVSWFLKEKQKDFNVQICIGGKNFLLPLIVSILLFVSLGIVVVKLGWVNKLPVNSWVIAGWGTFIFIETVLFLPVVIAQEYFFRGFLQTIFEKNLGIVAAIVLQAFAAVGFEYFFQDQISPFSIGLAALLTLFLGIIVKYSRSIWVTSLIHWGVIVGIDLLIKRNFLS